MMNINCKISDKNEIKEFDYDEIVNLVDNSLEEKNKNDKASMISALKVFYDINFRKIDLDKIADYYGISKRKKRKSKLITDIVNFETNEENEYFVERRKTLWFYISELENDSIMSKYVVFN